MVTGHAVAALFSDSELDETQGPNRFTAEFFSTPIPQSWLTRNNSEDGAEMSE